jgi:hypothetical protein
MLQAVNKMFIELDMGDLRVALFGHFEFLILTFTRPILHKTLNELSHVYRELYASYIPFKFHMGHLNKEI